MLQNIVIDINWFILWYLIALSAGYLFLLITSLPEIFLRYKEVEIVNLSSLIQSHIMPHITVIVPAYNEEAGIIECIYSILSNDYTNIDIIVVNPGSTDKTLEKLINEFDLIPVAPFTQDAIKTTGKIKGYYVSRFLLNFTVIDKEHTNRSDTLNVGVNACRTDLCMTLDADTLLDHGAISKAIFYMLIKPNTISVGGGLYILNGNTYKDGQIIEAKMPLKAIYGFQACEYMRSFLFYRSGWNSFGGALCYAGAFTCFLREPLVQIGGFEAYNLAQDFEVITHLHAYIHEHHLPYNISFTPAAIAYTDVPGTLKTYWQQRFNWQYWTLHSLLRHKRILFNPNYGKIGFFTYPFYLFGEAFGAVVEFTAYLMVIVSWLLGILDVYWVLLIFIICWGFISLLTMVTALINFLTFKQYKKISDLFLMLFFIVIENIGFRQFGVICRTYATFYYFIEKTKNWIVKQFEHVNKMVGIKK